jgi:acyl-coenzyme A thioesterase PaaI-like protein
MAGLRNIAAGLCLAAGAMAQGDAGAQAAPAKATAAEVEIQRACLVALQEEKRAWLGKPRSIEVHIRSPKDGDVTARCRVVAQTASPAGPALTEYTVLLRVADLYILGVSAAPKRSSAAIGIPVDPKL